MARLRAAIAAIKPRANPAMLTPPVSRDLYWNFQYNLGKNISDSRTTSERLVTVIYLYGYSVVSFKRRLDSETSITMTALLMAAIWVSR